MQATDDGGLLTRRRGVKQPLAETDSEVDNLHLMAQRARELEIDQKRREDYTTPAQHHHNLPPHLNQPTRHPQHNPHLHHSTEGYGSTQAPSPGRSHMGRFYANEPASRAELSSTNSGPIPQYYADDYGSNGGPAGGPPILPPHNGLHQAAPPSSHRTTTAPYGAYPPHAPPHPAQLGHYPHTSAPQQGLAHLESVLDTGSQPLRVEKKEKGASGRPPPKPQSPLILQWLQDNFENDPKSSVPRSLMYSHYSAFCAQASVKAVNAASFGKLIRSVFPELKTRRLGTRGNSKYHYYGIRIKTSSPLKNAAVPPECESGLPNAPAQSASTTAPPPTLSPPSTSGTPTSSTSATASPAKQPRLKVETMSPTFTSEPPLPTAPAHLYPLHTAMNNPPPPMPLSGPHTEALRLLSEFPPIEPNQLLPGVRIDHAQDFMLMYKTHCQYMLNTMAERNFNEVEPMLRHFWQSLPARMRPVVACPGIIDLIAEKDELVYAAVVDVLVPDVLASVAFSFTQALREFSRQMEGYMRGALDGLPPALSERKIRVARNFAGRLWREGCMNYIACSARQVLMNTEEVNQILHDFGKIDTNYVINSISWVCNGEEPPHTLDLLSSVHEEFKRILQQRLSLEQFAEWIFHLSTRFLLGTDTIQVMNCAQQLLLRWSHYHTLVHTDLIARKAPSLQSFHMLRAFMEEYLTYVLDRRLATLQMLRPVALPTYTALPQPDHPAPGHSSRYGPDDQPSQQQPRSDYRSSPLGSVDLMPSEGFFMRPRSNPDLSNERFRPSILGKMPPSMFTSITERPHKQRRLAESGGPPANDRPPSPLSSSPSTASPSRQNNMPPSSASSAQPSTQSPLLASSSFSSAGTPSSPPLSSSVATTSSSSSAPPSTQSNGTSQSAPASGTTPPELSPPLSAPASSSSSSLLRTRTPSLPPLDLLDSLRMEGGSAVSPKPSLGIPPSSLSSFSLGMGSFSGFGRDSFTSGSGSYIPTAGGYTFPKMSFDRVDTSREMPLPSASFLHKASFGSFSSFPEFSRASFDRLGSMDRGSVAWPQLFLNMSTAHTSYQSFSLPISDDKSGPLPPLEGPPSPNAGAPSSPFSMAGGGGGASSSSSSSSTTSSSS